MSVYNSRNDGVTDYNSNQVGGSSNAPSSLKIVMPPQQKKMLQQLQPGQQEKMKQFLSQSTLVDISFNVTESQIKAALSTLAFLPEIKDEQIAKSLPEALRDHIKSAMFITMKSMQMKSLSFHDIFISAPESLLRSLVNLLHI